MRVTARWLTLFLLLIGTSSCGYLDQDLLTNDDAFAESFETEGLGLHGHSISSGCGGFGRLGHRHRSALTRFRVSGHATLELGTMTITAMSDRDILENTEIGVIDESEPLPANASLPEQAYYEQMEKRNRAIAESY